jgi:hypothetical protein
MNPLDPSAPLRILSQRILNQRNLSQRILSEAEGSCTNGS